MNKKWDRRFLNLAVTISSWSKDAGTRVSALIVDENNRVVSTGYNGFPRGVRDDDSVDRDEKLRRTIHAEENALLFAGRDVTGCTMYITHPPCGRCAAKLIQAGITRIVYLQPSEDFVDRWSDEMASAAEMFREVKMQVEVPSGLFLWEGE